MQSRLGMQCLPKRGHQDKPGDDSHDLVCLVRKTLRRLVIAGHGRSKNGVASLAYDPAIPLRDAVPI